MSFQKMVLVPFNKDPDVETAKSELDHKMEEILQRTDITDYDKIKLYQQTLGIYLRLNSSFNPTRAFEDFNSLNQVSPSLTTSTTSFANTSTQPIPTITLQSPSSSVGSTTYLQSPSSGVAKLKIQSPTETTPPKALTTNMLDLINNLSQEEFAQINAFLNNPNQTIDNTPNIFKNLYGNETLTSKDDTFLSTNKSNNEHDGTPLVLLRDSIKKNLNATGFLTPDNTANESKLNLNTRLDYTQTPQNNSVKNSLVKTAIANSQKNSYSQALNSNSKPQQKLQNQTQAGSKLVPNANRLTQPVFNTGKATNKQTQNLAIPQSIKPSPAKDDFILVDNSNVNSRKSKQKPNSAWATFKNN